MRFRFLCVAAVGVAMSTAATVRADDDSQPPKPNDRVWYGWQTLAVDAAAIAVWAPTPGDWAGTSPALAPIAAALFLSAPIMHALNHRWAAFGTSLAMRVLIGFTFATVGLGVGYATCPYCDLTTFDQAAQGLYIGAMLGMGVSALIDSAVLGWAPRFKLRTTQAWNIVPSLSAHGGSLAFVKTF